MTWKDIKVATLQKMEASDGNEIPTDDSVTDYVAAMPQAANEALLLLSTAGKFIIKSISIGHNPMENLIPDGQYINSRNMGELEFEADNAHSFYFEIFPSGVTKIEILVDGEVSRTFAFSRLTGYQSVKGIIENTDKKVIIRFASKYPYAIKNVAMYESTYESDEDVFPYTEVVKYRMTDLAEDFYQLDNEQIYYEADDNTSRYIRASEYFQEGNKVLVLPRDMAGNFIIYYRAYPPEITTATPDDYELPIDREVASLLPLYMASQIYKGDEIGIATTYRNEFEVAREALTNKSQVQIAEEFTSESGWY